MDTDHQSAMTANQQVDHTLHPTESVIANLPESTESENQETLRRDYSERTFLQGIMEASTAEIDPREHGTPHGDIQELISDLDRSFGDGTRASVAPSAIAEPHVIGSTSIEPAQDDTISVAPTSDWMEMFVNYPEDSSAASDDQSPSQAPSRAHLPPADQEPINTTASMEGNDNEQFQNPDDINSTSGTRDPLQATTTNPTQPIHNHLGGPYEYIEPPTIPLPEWVQPGAPFEVPANAEEHNQNYSLDPSKPPFEFVDPSWLTLPEPRQWISSYYPPIPLVPRPTLRDEFFAARAASDMFSGAGRQMYVDDVTGEWTNNYLQRLKADRLQGEIVNEELELANLADEEEAARLSWEGLGSDAWL